MRQEEDEARVKEKAERGKWSKNVEYFSQSELLNCLTH